MIPVGIPWLPGNERKYVHDAIDTNWISGVGGYIRKFEGSFAKFCGVKYAITCSSGYAALHLACATLGLKKGDEVIVPTFTMAACTNAIIMTGAKPVLVDSEPETYNIDPEKIEEKITTKTKAIMVVHIYGHPCEMDKIMEIAKKHDLKVIEDCAEAHGAEYNGKKVGGIGDIGCFSFYSTKIMTTGEGGMCTTNNPEIDREIRALKEHYLGVSPTEAYTKNSSNKFLHEKVGFNYRMTNLQAAIGLAQVENAEMLVNAKISLGGRYTQQLKDVKGLILPKEKPGCKNVYWMYGVVLGDEIKMDNKRFMEKLADKGIETRIFFLPMHNQPAYYNKTVENAPDCNGSFPVAEKISKMGFYLPSTGNLTDGEIKQVCDAVKEIFREMAINGIEVHENGIVHENEDRKVFEIFNDYEKEADSFLAKNERAFIIKKEGFIGDHYREDWEYYYVLYGEAHFFFENMKTGERDDYVVKTGGKIKLPPNICIAVKGKVGTIILGRYKKPFQELKTNKHVLEWARKVEI